MGKLNRHGTSREQKSSWHTAQMSDLGQSMKARLGLEWAEEGAKGGPSESDVIEVGDQMALV